MHGTAGHGMAKGPWREMAWHGHDMAPTGQHGHDTAWHSTAWHGMFWRLNKTQTSKNNTMRHESVLDHLARQLHIAGQILHRWPHIEEASADASAKHRQSIIYDGMVLLHGLWHAFSTAWYMTW